MDRLPDPWIGAAAADVAAHRAVDLLVAGLRVRLQQRRGGHDLARLAVPALRRAELDPGLLDRVAAVVRQALDGGDLRQGRHARCDGAGARGPAVEVDGAGAALRHAAAELGALEPQDVAQEPEQGHVAVRVDVVDLAVDVELEPGHLDPPSPVTPRWHQNFRRSSNRTP